MTKLSFRLNELSNLLQVCIGEVETMTKAMIKHAAGFFFIG